MAEAMAEYAHKRIRAELGFAGEDDRDMDRLLQQGYRGSRYSFGYPACPRLEDQVPLLSLLGAERIGVSLSDGYQLHPEQSTSALVILNPQAKYFTV
jgi:5-methyltetrahydrofolate--homocysteine methyltransferase